MPETSEQIRARANQLLEADDDARSRSEHGLGDPYAVGHDDDTSPGHVAQPNNAELTEAVRQMTSVMAGVANMLANNNNQQAAIAASVAALANGAMQNARLAASSAANETQEPVVNAGPRVATGSVVAQLTPVPPGLGGIEGEDVTMDHNQRPFAEANKKTNRIDNDVMKRLNLVMKEFTKRVDAAIRIKELSKRNDEAIEQLGQGKFPAGVRPFKMPFISEEWDEPYLGPKKLEIELPDGLTAREAKKQMYIEYHIATKTIDAKVMEARSHNLMNLIKYDDLIDECIQQQAARNKDMMALGSTLPGYTVTENDDSIRLWAGRQYKMIISKMADKKHKLKIEKERLLKKQKKIKEEAAKLDTRQVLISTIRDVVGKGKGKGKHKGSNQVDYVEMMAQEIKGTQRQPILKSENAQPKNQQSPGDGLGQNPKNVQNNLQRKWVPKRTSKGKGKGTWQAKGKSKGKGKAGKAKGGKGPRSGKGKGAN